MRITPLSGALCALALFAAPAVAQNKLTTLFAANNGGSVGGAVYFDITVTNAVRIIAFDVNTTSSGAPINMDVYLTANGGTHVGNTTNPGVWTNTVSGTGTSAGQNNPSTVTLNTPLLLQPGVYGVALHAVDYDNDYTNGTGANQQYSDNFIQLDLGEAANTLWGSPFSPRVANITVCYNPGSGLFVNFTGTPTVGNAPLAVQFTDNSFSSAGTITGYAWDFGDGNTSTAQNPSHTYTTGGNFTVKLTVSDSTFGSGTETKVDYIQVDIPKANFTATPTAGAAPLTVQFTDTSTGNPNTWAWDFGDGNTSTAQNPSHTYVNGGQYSVKLTASNANGGDTLTLTDLITVLGATNNTKSAEILEYGFNEVRGQTVGNSASTTEAPSHGTVSNAGWQTDPGRAAFRGNEVGAGCVAAGAGNLVQSGYPLNVTNCTIMWQQRTQTAAGTALAYTFGGAGASVRCFTGGVAGNTLWYRGTPIGDIKASYDVQVNVGVWDHIALVIDDTNGVATWYVNGTVDTVTNFTPGTHVATNTNFHIGYHTSTTSTYARHYDIDDFRLYARALSAAEVSAAGLQENASTTTFGPGCDGPNGPPMLDASGGAPCIGNANFAIEASNIEVSRPAALNLGGLVNTALLPFDLTPFLGAGGCQAELFPDFASVIVPGPAASLPIPIPNVSSLAGAHVYGQLLVLGSQGAASAALDINVQN